MDKFIDQVCRLEPFFSTDIAAEAAIFGVQRNPYLVDKPAVVQTGQPRLQKCSGRIFLLVLDIPSDGKFPSC